MSVVLNISQSGDLSPTINKASPLGGCSFGRDESGQDVVWHADDLFPLPACVIPQGGGHGGGGKAGGAEISLGSEADA